MSALVKLQGNSGLFQLTEATRNLVHVHPKDKKCIMIEAGSIVNMRDGTEIEDGVIQSNQTVMILPNVPLTPYKYHTLVGHNPELSLLGALVSPIAAIVRPGEADKIGLIVRTSKKIDISELSHVLELFQID